MPMKNGRLVVLCLSVAVARGASAEYQCKAAKISYPCISHKIKIARKHGEHPTRAVTESYCSDWDYNAPLVELFEAQARASLSEAKALALKGCAGNALDHVTVASHSLDSASEGIAGCHTESCTRINP